MEISIIIPVYKVEKYIDKCLSSIFSQNIDSSLFEVIIVNDGTPDSSMSIVQSYVDKFNNIIVINQDNQGLSIARNAGIQIAQGKYIWCVDSDDWLPDKSLYNVLSKLRYDCDAVKILLCRNYEPNGISINDKYNKYLSGKTEMKGKDFIFDEGQYSPAQSIIYKKKFLEDYNLFFFPHIYHEDGEFGLRALYLAKKILLINSVCYCYRIRSNDSIMSTFKLKNFQDLILIYKNLIAFKKEFVNREDYANWDGLIVNILYLFFRWAKNKSFEKNFSKDFWALYNENKSLFNQNLYKILRARHFHKSSIKKYVILRFFPKLYFI